MSLLGSLTSGVSALTNFEKGIEVIGNNVANVNTTGFKASHVNYADSFSNMLQDSAPSTASGSGSNTPAIQIGTGVEVSAVSSDFSQGTLTPSGSETDLAIAGQGYFRVHDSSNGSDFVTRAGDFRTDDQGFIVTSDGLHLQGLNDGGVSYTATSVGGVLTYTKTDTAASTVGDLKVDFSIGNVVDNTGGAFTAAQIDAGKPTMSSFSIDKFGNINIALSNGDSFVRGKVLLQNFRDSSALVRQGNNLFSNFAAAGPEGGTALTATNNSAGTNGLGGIQSKALELSNVDLSTEFANLISTQRAFQAGSRIVTVTDSILEEIINLKR